MSSKREKLRALFLAFVMASSVMVGTVALSGSAAADDTTSSPSVVSAVGDTTADEIFVAFSEPVYGDNNNQTALSSSDFTVEDTDDNQIDPTVSAVSGKQGTNPGSAVYKLSISADLVGGDLSTATIDLDNNVFDANGNTISAAEDVVTVNGPSTTTPEVIATNAEAGTQTIEVFFNQPVESENGDAVAKEDMEIAGGTDKNIDNVKSSSAGDVAYVIDSLSGNLPVGDLDTSTIKAISPGGDTPPGVRSAIDGSTESTGSTIKVQDTSVPTIKDLETEDADNDGTVDRIDVTLSENIDKSDSTLSASTFDFPAGSIGSVDDSGTPNDNNIDIEGITGLSSGTDVTPDVTLKAGQLQDDSEELSLGNDGPSITSSDSARPIITGFTANEGSNQATVTFSEPVRGGNGGSDDLSPIDFAYTDNSGSDASAITSVSHTATSDTATLTLNSEVSSNDIGSDTIANADNGPNNIDDAADNNAITTAQTLTSGSAALPGSTSNDMKFEIGTDTTAEIRAGVANNTVDAITLKDDASNSRIAFASDIVITMPQGVTINQSASSLSTSTIITSDSDGVAIDSVSVDNSDNQGEITLTTSGQSNPGEEILFKTGSVVLNADDDADAGSTSDSLNIKVDNFQGEANLGSGAIDVRSPTAASPGSFSLAAGKEDQSGFSGNEEIKFDASTGGVVQNIERDRSDPEPLIDGGTEIVYTLEPGSGVSFDVDKTQGNNLLANNDIDSADSDDELDQSGITVTQDSITVPVVDPIQDSDTSLAGDIRLQNLVFETTGDATDADLNVTVEAPKFSTGAYNVDGTSSSPSTISNYVTVQNPDVDVDDSGVDTFAIGGDQRYPTNGQSGLDSTDDINLEITDTNGGQMAAGENITVRLNSSNVTFDTSLDSAVTISPDEKIGTGGETVVDDDNVPAFGIQQDSSSTQLGDVTINENNIQIEIRNQDSNQGDDIQLDDIGLNVSTDAPDGEDVEFEVVTKPGAGSPEVISSATDSGSNQFFELKRPDLELGGSDASATPSSSSNITFDVDADGFTDTQVDSVSSPLVIEPDELGQVADDTNVSIRLEQGTGVTFDTSSDAVNVGNNDDDGVIDVSSNDDNLGIDRVQVFRNRLDIVLNDEDDTGSDVGYDTDSNGIVIDDLVLNATGSASNTEISVTTNANVSDRDQTNNIQDGGGQGIATPLADNKVTTTLDKILEVNRVNPQEIKIDPEKGSGDRFGDKAFGADQNIEQPTVTDTITSAVKVQDGGSGFGGADVNLEIVQTPDGATGSALNTTLVTTNETGGAAFNFTAGDTTGDYVVNASIDDVSGGVNVTYTAQPGSIAGVSVTPIENAIAGDSADTGVAALFVNSTDANGNKVTGSSPTVEITADNAGASEVDSTDEFDNTKNTVSGLSGGTFSLHATDGSSVVYVKSSQTEDVTVSATISGESDDGTVTFFEQVGSIDLSLNETSAAVDDTVSADATITEEDGTTIEVPDVNVDFDDNNNGNTTFDTNADSESETTNTNGVASVNVTAEQNGTSTIDATANLRTASATLTIEGQQEAEPPTATVTFDDQSVQNGSTSVDVASATFNGSEDFVIVVHRASPGDNGVVDGTDEIGNKIGSSDVLTSNTVSDVPVNLTKNLDEGGNTRLTENQTLIAMLHFANESGDTNFGSPIVRDGTPVFDQAEITIAPESPLDGPAAEFDEDGDGDIDINELGDAGAAFARGEISIGELGDIGQVFAS